mmetsp:Transcript_65442/g.115922  ORF Transcript_65442/g.115922 Transcript_65442/m.115922 type:complete len:220 (+) Transcript_65442:50-709(+)
MAARLTEDAVKKMTVPKLRDSLEERGMDESGLKAALMERLLVAVEAENALPTAAEVPPADTSPPPPAPPPQESPPAAPTQPTITPEETANPSVQPSARDPSPDTSGTKRKRTEDSDLPAKKAAAAVDPTPPSDVGPTVVPVVVPSVVPELPQPAAPTARDPLVAAPSQLNTSTHPQPEKSAAKPGERLPPPKMSGEEWAMLEDRHSELTGIAWCTIEFQ